MFKWFKPKQSVIEFRCREEDWDVIPKPYPARKLMPNWYKDLVPKLDSRADSSTIKRCAPFLDAMIVGFFDSAVAKQRVVGVAGVGVGGKKHQASGIAVNTVNRDQVVQAEFLFESNQNCFLQVFSRRHDG